MLRLRCVGIRMLILAGALAAATNAATGAPEAVKTQQPELWLRWVIPMPKEVSIPQQVTLPAADVKLTLRAGADELEQNALRELQALFLEKAGVSGGGGAFEILLGVCDEQGRIGDAIVPDAARHRGR